MSEPISDYVSESDLYYYLPPEQAWAANRFAILCESVGSFSIAESDPHYFRIETAADVRRGVVGLTFLRAYGFVGVSVSTSRPLAYRRLRTVFARSLGPGAYYQGPDAQHRPSFSALLRAGGPLNDLVATIFAAL